MYDWPKGYYEQPKGREHSKHIQIVALARREGLTCGLAETLGSFMGNPYPYPAGTGSHGSGPGMTSATLGLPVLDLMYLWGGLLSAPTALCHRSP